MQHDGQMEDSILKTAEIKRNGNFRKHQLYLHIFLRRDQARGRLGRNSRTRGQNFALNGTQGEVGVSLKKKKKKIFFFFFRETHFHSVTTQMQAVVTLSNNLLPLHRVSPSIKWQQYV